MKSVLAFGTRILICLALAAVAYFWATGLMESIYAFRSPLKDSPPAPGEPLAAPGAQPITRRVVFVLIDGLRLDTALDEQVMPNLAQLRRQGAWAAMHSRPPTFSAPAYTVLFTGAWPYLSDGPALNPEDDAHAPRWTQDDLFSAAHRLGLKTAISGYIYFEGLVPQSAVDASLYTPEADDRADQQVMAAALPWLQGLDYQLVLIHLDQVDYAGHYEGGALDPRWNEAARRADAMLAQVAEQLDFKRDTLLVASDHGHINAGGHGGHEPVTWRQPFLLVGTGVQPGQYGDVEMVDVAPTLAALLGANLPASSQGRVRFEMLDLPVEYEQSIQKALEAQQKSLLQAYTAAIVRADEPQPGDDPVVTYQAALESARQSRLNAERLPRFLLAFLAAILPLIWFWKQRRPEIGWFLGVGLLYLALFNLRYAILDGRSYSLSSVVSADDLIQFSAITAAGALLLSWLAVAALRKLYRLPPGQAGLLTLDACLATLYLLLLPALWSFALNGAVVTWTLPDFPSMFLGFVSLLQILIVALVGLTLAGISAIISWIFKK